MRISDWSSDVCSSDLRIRSVDVVVGPGNAWVAEAKHQLYGTVGIDMVAGPSEILVIADGRNDPEWIAAGLLSQVEHDATAKSIFFTVRKSVVEGKGVSGSEDLGGSRSITKKTN